MVISTMEKRREGMPERGEICYVNDRWPIKKNGKGGLGEKEPGRYSRSELSKKWLSRLILGMYVSGRVGTKEDAVQMRNTWQAFGIYCKKCHTSLRTANSGKKILLKEIIRFY